MHLQDGGVAYVTDGNLTMLDSTFNGNSASDVRAAPGSSPRDMPLPQPQPQLPGTVPPFHLHLLTSLPAPYP